MIIKRVFFWSVLVLVSMAAFGLAVLYLDVQPQLHQIEEEQQIQALVAVGLRCSEDFHSSPWMHDQPSALNHCEQGYWEFSHFEYIQSETKQYWDGGYFDESYRLGNGNVDRRWPPANRSALAIGRLASRTLLFDAPEDIGGTQCFTRGVIVIVVFLGLGLFIPRMVALEPLQRLRNYSWTSDRDGHDRTSDSGPEIDYEPPESGTVTQGHREAAGKGWDNR